MDTVGLAWGKGGGLIPPCLKKSEKCLFGRWNMVKCTLRRPNMQDNETLQGTLYWRKRDAVPYKLPTINTSRLPCHLQLVPFFLLLMPRSLRELKYTTGGGNKKRLHEEERFRRKFTSTYCGKLLNHLKGDKMKVKMQITKEVKVAVIEMGNWKNISLSVSHRINLKRLLTCNKHWEKCQLK